jgi:hypothetical protein
MAEQSTIRPAPVRLAAVEQLRTLLEAPSPAVLTTHRMRREIAARYLGADTGVRIAEARRAKPGVLLGLEAPVPRVRDLAATLPR